VKGALTANGRFFESLLEWRCIKVPVAVRISGP
jgi:hypothetical protein